MLSDKETQEYLILKIISNSPNPVGSGVISEELKTEHVYVSEATIGRILREMDYNGLTEKVGFKGRILTAEGLKRYKDLEHDKEIRQYGYQLMNLLKVGKKSELIDILIARRAIEREIARLAAPKITTPDINKLHDIIDSHEKHYKNNESGAQDDVDFHRFISDIANNKILNAAMDLIRKNSQLSPVLEYIRKSVKSTVVADHRKIVKALEMRSPNEAEKAMVEHIENIIKDVNRYWEKVQ